MAVWHFAQLYGGAALILAALVMFRYIVGKTSGADDDTKKAFRPLTLIALAFIILGLGSISVYLEEMVLLTGILEIGTRYVYLLSYAAGVTLIGIAGVWILNNRRFYLIPAGAVISAVVLVIFALVVDPTNQPLYEDIGSLILSIVLVIVGIVFGWIGKETKRGTSAALAFALITQIGSIPRIYEILVLDEWALLIIFFLLMGPAMVIYAFTKTEQEATFELVGYGAAFSAAMLILLAVTALPVPLTAEENLIVVLGAIGAMFCLGTVSYLFGRWRETKQIPTFIYMIAFGAFYLGQMIGMFGATGVVSDPTMFLYDFILASIALALIATASIMATGRRSISLLPVVVLVPIITVMLLNFEDSIGDLFLENLILMIPAIVIFILPVLVFIAVWKRMHDAGMAAAGRPLGMAVGIVLFFLARLPPLIIGLPGLDYGYGLVASSFIVSWLAITGRLNRTLKTE